MFRRLLALTACAALLAGSSPVAQDTERNRAETLSQQAAERLKALHDEADRLAAEERTLLGDLRKLELDRDIRATELTRARSDVRTAASELAALDQQVADLTGELQAARPDLRARLVTLYKLGRGQYARLLLSASDLRQLGQAVRLVSALSEQDRQRVAQYQQRLAGLTAARAAIAARQTKVQELQAAAERAQAAAEQALAAHAALVHDIDSRRDLNAQYAGELQAAQQRLQASLSGLSSPAVPDLPLAPFKGDLQWPVIGTVRQYFGATVSGRPPLRGVEIEAPQPTMVHAVHDGMVAYADVFTGYGRLVILDHGNQAFTLYGNLAGITAQKGARVQRGEAIGTVGLAGGGPAGLYFEVRIDGRPVDPLQWLAKR